MAVNLGDSEDALAQAFGDLNKHWDRTGGVWRDKAREDFQKEYLDELNTVGKAAAQSLHAARELLKQAIQECS